jgi:hypothetical protein
MTDLSRRQVLAGLAATAVAPAVPSAPATGGIVGPGPAMLVGEISGEQIAILGARMVILGMMQLMGPVPPDLVQAAIDDYSALNPGTASG